MVVFDHVNDSGAMPFSCISKSWCHRKFMAGLEERVTKSFLRTECHSETETKKQINTTVKNNYLLEIMPGNGSTLSR